MKARKQAMVGLLGIFAATAVFAAQDDIVLSVNKQKVSHLTVQPEVLRAVCAQAVEREDTETRRTVVSEVWPTAYTDTTISCVVDGKLIEGSRQHDSPGYITVNPVRYRVQVDLQTQKAEIVRTGVDGAKQAALDAIADKLITLKATAFSTGSTTYTAEVAGKKCVVEVGEDAADGAPDKWVAKQVKCH